MRNTFLSLSRLQRQSVLEKYGGIEHLEAPPRELIFSQTEDYVEYTRHGKIIKGEEDPKVSCIANLQSIGSMAPDFPGNRTNFV